MVALLHLAPSKEADAGFNDDEGICWKGVDAARRRLSLAFPTPA
jgi:hypothetical protein